MRNELDEIEKELSNAGYQVQTDVMIDNKQRNAGHNIIEYAEDKQVDVIMIGNRGLGNVKGFFLVIVSSQVIQHATCNVYVIKYYTYIYNSQYINEFDELLFIINTVVSRYMYA